jgi:aldehyde dehydrogenase
MEVHDISAVSVVGSFDRAPEPARCVSRAVCAWQQLQVAVAAPFGLMFSCVSMERARSRSPRRCLTTGLGLPEKYGLFINGKFVDPVDGEYFDNISPINGQTFIKAARGKKADVDKAVAAATEAFKTHWSKVSVTERSNVLLKIASAIEENKDRLAKVETVDNGKAVRETMAADLPLTIDHFKYFAGVIRAEEGSATEIDVNTVSLCIQEPLGVVGQIIPWNFPLLMAAWKLAPALAAGNCVVMKPAEQTPTSIMVLMDILKDVIPPGVINVVTGFGKEAGEALATSKGIAKIAFTGSTATGQRIMKAAGENLIPATLELGGKSPNIFFPSVMDKDDEFLDKAVEGAVLFALNQGEVCTCQSRLLVHEDIFDKFMERVVKRTEAIKTGHPLDADTMMGAQVSKLQHDKIVNYIKIGTDEGAKVLTGGAANDVVSGGFYIKPTILQGTNNMRVFQEEIFGPVTGAVKFKSEEEAVKIANDTVYGLGAGVWTRDAHQAYQVPRAIQAGRVWVNCYHAYPAHAPFGGYKQSGIGRETHKMMLASYRQTKNMLISLDKNKLGFF